MLEINKLRYVRDTLFSIVTALASGLEPLQARLEHQYREFKMLRPDEFPEDMQGNYERIMSELMIEEKKREASKLPATLEGMPDYTAQAIAEEIVHLYQRMERACPTE